MNENIEDVKKEIEEELKEQDKKELAEDLENFGETEEVLLLKNQIKVPKQFIKNLEKIK